MLLAPGRTEVAYWHGMDRLVGDVVLPPWPGPHPGVVLVRPPRTSGRPCSWQARLAAVGIASLAYDPAGTGRSTGDWKRQTVGDRASEVLAAREVLVAQGNVAQDAVALLAVGEGAWPTVRAEAFARTFAGVVLLSPCVLDPVAVEQYRLGRLLERHAVPADEIGLAVALLRERFRRFADGESLERVRAAETACQGMPWYGLMPALRSPEDTLLLTRLVGVEPAPELEAVPCPVLTLNGADDRTQPVQRNVETILAALRAGGHTDHACVVVPDADDELRAASGEIAPGVHELVVTWLDRRLSRARRAASARGSVATQASAAATPAPAAVAAVPAPAVPARAMPAPPMPVPAMPPAPPAPPAPPEAEPAFADVLAGIAQRGSSPSSRWFDPERNDGTPWPVSRDLPLPVVPPAGDVLHDAGASGSGVDDHGSERYANGQADGRSSNGHLSNGYASGSYAQEGHPDNGYVSNGYAFDGYAADGHAANGYSGNGHDLSGHPNGRANGRRASTDGYTGHGPPVSGYAPPPAAPLVPSERDEAGELRLPVTEVLPIIRQPRRD